MWDTVVKAVVLDCVGVGRSTNRRQRFPSLLLRQVLYWGIIFLFSQRHDPTKQITATLLVNLNKRKKKRVFFCLFVFLLMAFWHEKGKTLFVNLAQCNPPSLAVLDRISSVSSISWSKLFTSGDMANISILSDYYRRKCLLCGWSQFSALLMCVTAVCFQASLTSGAVKSFEYIRSIPVSTPQKYMNINTS